VFNANKGFPARNTDALQLGEEIGLSVMGPDQWAQYVTTSAKEMPQ